jgi:hypothetical protein
MIISDTIFIGIPKKDMDDKKKLSLMNDLRELAQDRIISKLHVEIYKKPTGLNSIESMQVDIEKKNKEILKLENVIPNYKKNLEIYLNLILNNKKL